MYLKIGFDVDRDVELAQAVRDELGPNVAIRVDANERAARGVGIGLEVAEDLREGRLEEGRARDLPYAVVNSPDNDVLRRRNIVEELIDPTCVI